MTTPAPPSYAGYRFPVEVISFAVWLYFRFPLSLRHVDEILAARGIVVSHETIRQWGLKFGQGIAKLTDHGTSDADEARVLSLIPLAGHTFRVARSGMPWSGHAGSWRL